MSIAYTDPTDVVVPECPYPESVAAEHSEKMDIPCTPFITAATSPITDQPFQSTAAQPSQPTTTQPSKAGTASQSSTSEAEPDPDDDNYLANPEPDNEHVGVDEEGLYLSSVPLAASHEVVSESSDSDSESGSDSDEEYEEEDGLVGKDPVPSQAPVVVYYKDDPPMTVGTIYPNMSEFKLTLAQHAIKKEFEYNTEKSDPGRFRCYCSRKKEEKCKWRCF